MHLVRDALPRTHDRPRVIGVGNPWRRDDGAGPAVARNVGGECTTDPSRLLELWAGASWAVVVDAACSDAPAGTIDRFDGAAEPLPAGVGGRRSTHAFGVAAAIELARALGRLPPRLEVITITGADFGAGTGLTPAVARATVALSHELAAAIPKRSFGLPRMRAPRPTRTLGA